jgi:hypothetical protein
MWVGDPLVFPVDGIMNELQDFHRFLGDRIANGGTEATPEECLDLWRADHPRDDELEAECGPFRRLSPTWKLGTPASPSKSSWRNSVPGDIPRHD